MSSICTNSTFYLQYLQICKSDIRQEILLIFANLICYNISPKNRKFVKFSLNFAKYRWIIGFVVDQKYLKIIVFFPKKSQYFGIFSIINRRKKFGKISIYFFIFPTFDGGGDIMVTTHEKFLFRDIAKKKWNIQNLSNINDLKFAAPGMNI